MADSLTEEHIEAIADYLAGLPQPGQSLYAVVDASKDPYVIPHTLEAMASNVVCLFKGDARENLGDQTAWIAQIDRQEQLLEWLMEEGWGKRWGFIALSDFPLDRFATHLRKFTKVVDAEGVEHFFRFYDPQVLRQYLPVFDQKQHDLFFRGVRACFIEDSRDPQTILRYRSDDGTLVSQAVPLNALAGGAAESLELA